MRMSEKTVGLKAKYLAARTGILFSLENITHLQYKQKILCQNNFLNIVLLLLCLKDKTTYSVYLLN